MNEQCSITGVSIDERAARLTALQVVLGAAVLLVFPSAWIAAVLGVDFCWRSFVKGRKSPLAAVSRLVLRVAGGRPRLVDVGPKLFAARLGLSLLVAITGACLAGWILPARILAGMLLACASLEAFAGYCVGCRIYSLIQRVRSPRIGGLNRA